MGVREATVEKLLHSLVTEAGGITRKWVAPGVCGVPDRIVILNGEVYFVEVKTVDGVLSPIQKREHERLRSAGAKVYTVFGAEDVHAFMKEITQ